MRKRTPLGTVEETHRHFQIIPFEDRYGSPCTLQQSSLLDEEYADKPGATAVWLGIDRKAKRMHDGIFDEANQTRMHLDRKQVQKLIAVLEMWLQTGKFYEET